MNAIGLYSLQCQVSKWQIERALDNQTDEEAISIKEGTAKRAPISRTRWHQLTFLIKSPVE